MRWLVIAMCLVACKKAKKVEDAAEPAGPPSSGWSHPRHGSGHGSGSDEEPGAAAAVEADAGVADGPSVGGNGAAAYRDGSGHVHGPGGPVFMGRSSIACDADHDHCLREGVWFQTDNLVAGKVYRAVPVFELENAWWAWTNDTQKTGHLFKTKLATASTLRAGDTVIWFSSETSSNKWADSEYDALTSGRWEAGVVQGVRGSTFTVRGWGEDIPMDTGRVATEQKTVQ